MDTWIIVPLAALAIPIIAIILGHRSSGQKTKIRELELKKEIMELEIKKQDSTIKLLEEENKKFDRIIGNNTHEK